MTELLEAIVGPDVLRGLAIAMAGVVFAMAVSEMWLYYSRFHDPRDPWYEKKRLKYMSLIRAGIALQCLFVIGALLARVGDPQLTWRAPAAVIVNAILIVGMFGILRDDETIQDTGEAYRPPKEDP